MIALTLSFAALLELRFYDIKMPVFHHNAQKSSASIAFCSTNFAKEAPPMAERGNWPVCALKGQSQLSVSLELR